MTDTINQADVREQRFERLLAIKIDHDFYRRNDFDEHQMADRLFEMVQKYDLSDKDIEFIQAIWLACSQIHPLFLIRSERPKKGTQIRNSVRWEKRKWAQELAAEVDISVADGVKQESAVANAVQKYNVSRREVFRILVQERKVRRFWFGVLAEDPEFKSRCYIPEGFRLNEIGGFDKLEA